MTRTLCLLPYFLAIQLTSNACGKGDEKSKAEAKPKAAPVVAIAVPTPPPAQPPQPLPEDTGENQGVLGFAINHGSTGADDARGLAVDNNGDLLIAGYFKGAGMFGSDFEATDPDAYIAKLSGKDGSPLWSVQLGGPGADSAEALAVDKDDNVILVGSLSGTLTVGDGTLESSGADDVFIGKFDKEGRRLWVKRIGSNNIDAAQSVAVDTGGNIYVTGVFRGAVAFGEETLTSAGDSDIFLIKLSPSGDFVWSKQFGATGADYARDIAIDSQNHLVLLAEISVAVSFGGDELPTKGNRDIALAKLSLDGEHLWSTSMGNTYDDVAVSLAIDPADSILFTGSFEDTANYGGSDMVSKGRADLFVAKFSTEGKHQWTIPFGGKDKDWGNSISVDAFGNSYITGWFWYDVDFGGTALTSKGKRDSVLLKMSSTGTVLWAKSFGNKSRDMGIAVATAPDNGVFAVGAFNIGVTIGEQALTPTVGTDPKFIKGDVYVSRWGR